MSEASWGFHESPIATILQEHIEACEKPKEYKAPRKKDHLSGMKGEQRICTFLEWEIVLSYLSFFSDSLLSESR